MRERGDEATRGGGGARRVIGRLGRRRGAIFRLLVSLGVLTFVLTTIGLERIGQVLLTASPGPILLAFLLFVAGIVVRAARWRVLLRALGVHVPFGRLVHLYFAGTFFNAFLPSGFGGDVVRVLEIAQEARAAAALGTVVVDRMTGLMVLFAMALLALPFSRRLLPWEVWLAIGGMAAAGLVAGGLVLHGRWLRRLGDRLPGPFSLTGSGALARAYDAVTACGWRAVGQALALSLVFNTLLILVNYLTALAVGMRLSLVYFLLFVPVFSVMLILPVSIGGLGVREGMAVLLFTQVGVDRAVAVAASLAVYAVSRATGLLGGLLYLVQSLRALRSPR
ncbi:MAG TPA: flippase-like domain-containing protein [Chloroflexi bacterium]|nr:flippase-like domain-containing protein [Chloroflexota bacterium]